jgi:hypothetical protein
MRESKLPRKLRDHQAYQESSSVFDLSFAKIDRNFKRGVTSTFNKGPNSDISFLWKANQSQMAGIGNE